MLMTDFLRWKSRQHNIIHLCHQNNFVTNIIILSTQFVINYCVAEILGSNLYHNLAQPAILNLDLNMDVISMRFCYYVMAYKYYVPTSAKMIWLVNITQKFIKNLQILEATTFLNSHFFSNRVLIMIRPFICVNQKDS